MYQTEELTNNFSGLIISCYGEHCAFEKISGFESCDQSSLIFIQSFDQFNTKLTPAVIVTTVELGKKLQANFRGFVVCVADVKLAQALIKQHFDDYQTADQEWQNIHESAVIHPSTKLGNNCRIGPGVTIGANCKIGDRVIIRANAVIEHNVVIGADSVINSLANIGYACQLGARVIIQSGSIIGNEGYGFATDENGQHQRIPHTGNVVLHDDVHIGSNSCVDRGTYGSTVIHRGVKMDNLCHIAHNVEVGEHSLITAQCVVAGSSKIGKRVMMSGQTGVLDHKVVPDDTILVHRAGVTDSLPNGGMWAGSPAQPFKEFVRGLRLSKKVAKIEKEIKQLKNNLSGK